MAGSALEALLVGFGAIPGAWLRLKTVNHFEPMVPKKHWGTFAVNVIASFGLGLVLAIWQYNDQNLPQQRKIPVLGLKQAE